MADVFDEETTKVVFKKKGKFQGNQRKRKSSSSDGNSSDEAPVVKKGKRNITVNPLIQMTCLSNIKRPKPEHESDEGEEHKETVGVSYKSSRTADAEGPRDMGATATYELDTEIDRDAQAVFKKSLEINKELKGKEDDKIYRGQANYIQYIEKKDTAAGNAASGANRRGPMRAPGNLRSTVRWDYAPDVCKDYKETGFCGFGDSCKFLHDRSDYKHGWQLELDERNGRSRDTENVQPDITDEDRVPFKCYVCRNSFVDPVVTKCKHYFCEKCALEQYRKSKRCYVCSENTNGVFNPAKDIIAKLKAKKAAAEAAALDSD